MVDTVFVNQAVNANIKKVREVSTSELDDADTSLVRTSDDVTALTALGEANVAEIAVDANGTAIAAAVNGILDILIAAGLMEAGA